MLAEDFTEYCAALTAVAVYNVHRQQHAPFMQPDTVMYRSKARRGLTRSTASMNQPAPPTMRYALPGERPPSSRPPGVNDDVIERFDAFTERRKLRG